MKKGNYLFNVLSPETDEDGNLLLIKCKFTMAGIRMEVVQEIGYLILCGLQLRGNAYAPMYSPNEVLLITNDESAEGRDGRCVVLIQEGNFVIARRTIVDGRGGFRSILGNRCYVKDERLEMLGYVVGSVPDSEIIYEGERRKTA